MAFGALLEELRNSVLDSIKGRKIGIDFDGYLTGIPDNRVPVMGSTGGGSTVVSTATASLVPYGVSLVGSSGTSGATAYTLQSPDPGVRKVLFNPTTGVVNIATTLANFISTGSITSTYANITMAGKGASLELIGITTALWAVLDVGQISTGGPNVTFV